MALYFRITARGGAAFRVESEERLTLTPLADIVLRSGAVKPRAATPTAAERAEIDAWIAARRAALATEAAGAPARAVAAMNAAAEWMASKPSADHAADHAAGQAADRGADRGADTGADEAAKAAAADEMLIALHDLRTAIVRWTARRAAPDDP